MKTDTFIKRFQNQGIADNGSVKSKEFKSFATCFKNYLKRQIPEAEIIKYHVGHYDVSGFLKFPSGNLVYVSYSVPRQRHPIDVDRTDAHAGVLYRTAENDSDYHGGANNFTSLRGIKSIRQLDYGD